jgi:Fe-S oxidoreductase
MDFHPFVIPFAIGFFGLMAVLAIKIVGWYRVFDKDDKRTMFKNILSVKTLSAIKEIVSESLFHRKIFAINPLLGWMHMTYALGWFLLIVVGKIQTTIHTGDWTNPVWHAIFFRYFESVEAQTLNSRLLPFLMDAILLFILSGVALAFAKRMRSKAMGLTQTTRHSNIDKLALATIWSIFPLRFLAESITSGLHSGGSFLTGSAGQALAQLPFLDVLFLPAWWAYSLVLGTFFAILPLTRYMHIPAEMVLIIFRHWGVKDKNMVQLQIESCSRCGICIDGCATLPLQQKTQAVYLLRQARSHIPAEMTALTCMECGSCQSRCPVGIDTSLIRQQIKAKNVPSWPLQVETQSPSSPKSKILYYPGCIGKLTPSVTLSMGQIMTKAGLDFHIIDNNDMSCCGRPMLLTGNEAGANDMMVKNKAMIQQSGADTLVTSCPVCYKMFTDNYQLGINVVHHTQMIYKLIASNAIRPNISQTKYAYHDPCELGRGSNIYDEPRRVLKSVGTLAEAPKHGKSSMCCGGSAAGYPVDDTQRSVIAQLAVDNLLQNQPDQIVSGCPMCKKSLARFSDIAVKDIAEIVAEALHCQPDKLQTKKTEQKTQHQRIPNYQD